jgi:hypothetical protein
LNSIDILCFLHGISLVCAAICFARTRRRENVQCHHLGHFHHRSSRSRLLSPVDGGDTILLIPTWRKCSGTLTSATNAFEPFGRASTWTCSLNCGSGWIPSPWSRMFRQDSGLLRRGQCRLGLSEFFTQDDGLGNLSHGFTPLPAFRLHRPVRFFLTQR